MPKLVIVESPAKAKTIAKVLGRGYRVKASMGHVRDLPRSQFGVDVEHRFQPKYITIRGKGPILAELRQAAHEAEKVYLATDPDREGEAISWHLAQVLNLPMDESNRIEFHEITPRAIKSALQSPRPLDFHLIDAQQARRVLDRLVGYKLSPLLWAKVRPGLSAGRVQSVAVRLVVDREQEIEAFKPEEYWSLTAALATAARGPQFEATLLEVDGKKVTIHQEEEAKALVNRLQGAAFTVTKVVRRERRRYPAPPFTTSTLQQEASRRLGFTARRTMSVAQQLYEGLELGSGGPVGLITYMRTDSTRIAPEAQAEAAEFISTTLGREYRPATPPHYRNRPGIQGAHEAIRPTLLHRRPEDVKEFLKRDQYRLYRLIWERFVASQMSPAVYDQVIVDIAADGCIFRATGMTQKFPGFTAIYEETREEADHTSTDTTNTTKQASTGDGNSPDSEAGSQADALALPAELAEVSETDSSSFKEKKTLPLLEEGQPLVLVRLKPEQHFTQPPPRYSEASLIKALEEKGIGRPSTYAPIIETIKSRGYVELIDKRFHPTELGRVVVNLLAQYFPDIVDVGFTAHMEEQLDEVEQGTQQWQDVVERFYEPFAQRLQQAQQLVAAVELTPEETDVICENCGRHMVIKHGRFGKFLACPGYPECRNTKPLLKEIGVACPRCGRPLVERRSRQGRLFYGCSGYPKCDFTSWERPVGRCPRCGQLLVVRRSSATASCSDPECGFRQPWPGSNGQTTTPVSETVPATATPSLSQPGSTSAPAAVGDHHPAQE
ncbi:MAG: type I DNA topoisomerase [Limnochordaceae bacterium]|nr:type I DNA topoisomerase [Limnochordaceae bacterium]